MIGSRLSIAGRISSRNPDTVTLTGAKNPLRPRSFLMKALITAFALLSFVAATTVPVVAQAQTNTEKTMPKKATKKKGTKKVASHKKKSSSKMKKPNPA
jgi:hypothetical protein